MGVLLRFFNLSQPTMKVLFFVALVIPLLWLSLRPNPRLTPIPKPGTDITTVVGQDITEEGEDTTDGADTTDIPTDTDTVTWENALLMLNPKLKPNPKLMPPPGTDTTVDTTVIPTDTDMLVPTDTMAVTGGKLFTMNSHFI